ncbi:MAG: hypothetical protein K8R58_03140 [Bacteroidales bacterium]|nr:hypothetical protein [Bacteroidales bacterium]
MKTLKKIITAAIFIFVIGTLSAQSPPHPNGGNAPGSGNTPVGGGAPIGGGLFILLGLGAVYGGAKSIFYQKKENSL